MRPEELAALENDQDNGWRRYQVDYDPSCCGRMLLEMYKIPPMDKRRLQIIRDEGIVRDPGSGTFRKLVELVPISKEYPTGKKLWMSDTRAEITEHYPLFDQMQLLVDQGRPAVRVLINGLGLGAVVRGALTFPGVERVDVVELDEDVIDLVGPLVEVDFRVKIRWGNAYKIKWRPDSYWDVVWHDIWPDITSDNLSGMRQLLGEYKSRAGWQGCWQMEGCLAMDDVYRRMRNKTLPYSEALAIVGGKAPWVVKENVTGLRGFMMD